MKFFPAAQQEGKGRGGQTAQEGQQVGGAAGEEEDAGAEKQKIDAGAQEEGGHHVQPELSPAPGDGEEEDAGGGEDPEQQVQGGEQQREAEPVPDGAQQVVGQAQKGAQEERAQEGMGLVRQVDFHYRNSRARKPPRSAPSSS